VPRFEQPLRKHGTCVELSVHEVFVWRLDLPDGQTIRADNKGLWMRNGCSWFGPKPEQWDLRKAVWEPFRRSYVSEVDYS
jgi:hypothetical protein